MALAVVSCPATINAWNDCHSELTEPSLQRPTCKHEGVGFSLDLLVWQAPSVFILWPFLWWEQQLSDLLPPSSSALPLSSGWCQQSPFALGLSPPAGQSEHGAFEPLLWWICEDSKAMSCRSRFSFSTTFWWMSVLVNHTQSPSEPLPLLGSPVDPVPVVQDPEPALDDEVAELHYGRHVPTGGSADRKLLWAPQQSGVMDRTRRQNSLYSWQSLWKLKAHFSKLSSVMRVTWSNISKLVSPLATRRRHFS